MRAERVGGLPSAAEIADGTQDRRVVFLNRILVVYHDYRGIARIGRYSARSAEKRG